jgi:hypothetical protein
MAHYVKVASVLFQTEAKKGHDDAKRIVLGETAQTLESLKGFGLDLVVFSEGVESYGQRVEDAEEIASPGPFLKLYMDYAVSQRCCVAGSVKLFDGGKVYNSIAFVGPDGTILGVYHKTNLTVWEIEPGVSSGSGAVVVDTPVGRLGGIVCFDLNFEDIRNEYRTLRPDIIVFPSMFHGGLLQQIWAYQCRAYFVSALPRIGGGILDPFGTPLALTHFCSSVATATINLDRVMVHLDFNKERFPDIRRKYADEVEICVPANVDRALIISRTQKRSAVDIVSEFGVEPIDEYFDRSTEANVRNRRK